MMWLLLAYVILISVNFHNSLNNIETWAYRGRETNMQKAIRWICIVIVNPVFAVMYWCCYIYIYCWQIKDSKKRRKM